MPGRRPNAWQAFVSSAAGTESIKVKRHVEPPVDKKEFPELGLALKMAVLHLSAFKGWGRHFQGLVSRSPRPCPGREVILPPPSLQGPHAATNRASASVSQGLQIPTLGGTV